MGVLTAVSIEEAMPMLIEVDLDIIAFVQTRWLECQLVFIPSFPLGHNPAPKCVPI